MAFERLTVKLDNGEVYYFSAGSEVGDNTPRLDLLRDAIENDSVFSSVDLSGVERTFTGGAVNNYHLD